MVASPTRMEWRWPQSAASAKRSCNCKRRLYSTKHPRRAIIRLENYVDVEIGRSERVAVCGGEVTGVVGDVDVAVIADLRWKAPFQKS